jgi:hypothetical protein
MNVTIIHENKAPTVEDRTPKCGEDFCDSCGDCLHCYGGDTCWRDDSGKHYWVVYEEDEVD